jgi:hypothetical protein
MDDELRRPPLSGSAMCLARGALDFVLSLISKKIAKICLHDGRTYTEAHLSRKLHLHNQDFGFSSIPLGIFPISKCKGRKKERKDRPHVWPYILGNCVHNFVAFLFGW